MRSALVIRAYRQISIICHPLGLRQSGIVTIACYSIDETINTTNKRINDYSICTLYSTHNVFPNICNSGQSSEELSAVTCSHAFHFAGDHLIASHPVSRFTAHQLGCQCASSVCTLLYCTLSCNKAVFIHRTVRSTVSINLTWHSSECKGWHSKYNYEFCWG